MMVGVFNDDMGMTSQMYLHVFSIVQFKGG